MISKVRPRWDWLYIMSELLQTLGINGKLLIAQLVNFLIVLLILRWAVYKPLLEAMRKRRERIEFGIKGAEEADRRLAEVDVESQDRLRKADVAALEVVKDGEDMGKKRFAEIVHGAESKADHLLKEAAALSKRKEQEEMARLMTEAQGIIKAALIKTVELDPKHVDEKLIAQAIHEI